eukprot:scaffold11932_cov64-Phaeocystis_antarctica.AAC.4
MGHVCVECGPWLPARRRRAQCLRARRPSPERGSRGPKAVASQRGRLARGSAERAKLVRSSRLKNIPGEVLSSSPPAPLSSSPR